MRSSTSSSEARRRWRLAALLVFLVAPFAATELWVRASLFEHVSYTNSTSLDATLNALAADRRWTVAALGDSEVRWGFDGEHFDGALAQRALPARTFNLGIDGFSGALYLPMLSKLRLRERLPSLEVVLIGLQLIEAHRPVPPARLARLACEGALQRPVFASAFGRDTGLEAICRAPRWYDPALRLAEDGLATVRYRAPLRHFLLRTSVPDHLGFQSTGLPYRPSGYQPHLAIAQARGNFEDGWRRVLAEAAGAGPAYAPLPGGAWDEVTAPEGLLDAWLGAARALDALPVFFALPTNPILIDVKRRREDYARNSAGMARWAAARNVPYVDLGILDDLDSERDFADHRHLSERGARLYAERLATALAAVPQFRAALSGRAQGEQRAPGR